MNRALSVPLIEQAARNGESPPRSVFSRSLTGLWVFWLCLLVAAGQPYWLGEASQRPQSGRYLMLAIDISGSMQETDMQIGTRIASRIDVLKVVVSGFVDRREGDRIGLVLFGTRAYPYVPLTFDRDMLNELLLGVSTGLAGRLTAIGDAIGISIKTLSEQDARHKVLILVTDGSNTGGSSDPLNAARIAAHQGMTIYTIGVGNDDKTMRELVDQRNIPSGTILNEKMLRQIAAITGGQYFRARDTASLEMIYQQLNQLEPVTQDLRLHRPRSEVYHWPLIFGLLAFVLNLLLVPLASLISGLRKSDD